MPQTAPKYVRLTQHMVTGCQVDLDSGWGVSGHDVVEVPEDPAVQSFVRTGINRGIFEEASYAEFEDVQSSHFNPLGDEDIPKVIMIDPNAPIPEHVLRRLVDEHSGAVRKRLAEREAEALAIDETTDDQTLRTRLSAAGVNSGGSRAEVLSRLRALESSGSANVYQDTPYDDMSKAQLVAAAKRLGIPHGGTKDDLVERLEAYEPPPLLSAEEDDSDD